LARLEKIGVIPRAAATLKRRTPAAARALRAAILADVPALSMSPDPAIGRERERHAVEHLKEIHRLFAGGEIGELEFVRLHARRRAQQHFPLEVTLHAYRCGHQVLLRWMRAAAVAAAAKRREATVSAVADFAIEYTNSISAAMTAEYVAHARRLAEAEGDRRVDLLNALLGGYDESDGHLAQLLKRAGYLEPRQSFCVAVAQSSNPLEMQSEPRAQRIVEALTTAVASAKIRMLSGIRNNVVTAVFADVQRQSGWTESRASLAERVYPAVLVLGPAVLIGLSREHPALNFVPKALQEATAALGCAHVGERVVQFAKLPMRRLLLLRSGDYLRTALPPWIPGFIAADAKARGALSRTLRAYADADMNVIRAAAALRVHPNTLYARMQRVRSLSGLNSQRYHDLTELLLAVDCCGG